jgi:multiple sugar transport system substrate-binding protein
MQQKRVHLLSFFFPLLVPTLRVGTQGVRRSASRLVFSRDGTQSVPDMRSHAERGNKGARALFFFFPLSFLVPTLCVATLAGCRPTASPHPVSAPEHQSIELHIACPTEATAALLRSRGQSWALRQGAKIAVQLYDPSKESECPPPLSPSQRGIREGTTADVWVLSPADLPRWAAGEKIVPLPDAYKAAANPLVWSDLLPTWREQLVQWDGKAYGLPVVGEAPLCCYRADLLKDKPLTWEQFVRLAEHFRDKGVAGRPGPSLPPLPRSDADLDRLFYTVAAGFARRAVRDDEGRRGYQPNDLFSFHYDFQTGQPRIASPGFVHALRLLQRLQACRPAETADYPEEAFRDGRAVLCLADAPWIVTFQKTPALHDKVGICRVPGGERSFDYQTGQERQPSRAANWLPYLGGAGWLAVVSRSSGNPDAAFDLLADLAEPKTSTQIFLSSNRQGGPTRTGQLYRHRWDTFDLEDKQAVQLRDLLEETLLHRNLKNPVLCLRTPRQAAHRAVLVRGLREALLKGADAEKTLQEVADEWRKLDREQGVEQHKADYRRSLGLLAKE